MSYREMTIEALAGTNVCTLVSGSDPGLADRFPVRLTRGQAAILLTAIERGGVHGIAIRTSDGTTCWQCEWCGKARTGRGCLTCAHGEIATQATQLAHFRKECVKLIDERDAASHLSHRLRNERDRALSALDAALSPPPVAPK